MAAGREFTLLGAAGTDSGSGGRLANSTKIRTSDEQAKAKRHDITRLSKGGRGNEPHRPTRPPVLVGVPFLARSVSLSLRYAAVTHSGAAR